VREIRKSSKPSKSWDDLDGLDVLSLESVVIDYEKLADTVRNGVHLLDNVIDMNKYPLEKIKKPYYYEDPDKYIFLR